LEAGDPGFRSADIPGRIPAAALHSPARDRGRHSEAASLSSTQITSPCSGDTPPRGVSRLGQEKAPAVRRTLAPERGEEPTPRTRVAEHGEVIWVLDKDAASELPAAVAGAGEWSAAAGDPGRGYRRNENPDRPLPSPQGSARPSRGHGDTHQRALPSIEALVSDYLSRHPGKAAPWLRIAGAVVDGVVQRPPTFPGR